MAPGWLTALAWVHLGICFVCAGMIAYDIFVKHRRQPMGVTDAVFPITAALLWPVCARALPSVGARRGPAALGAE